jgi:hypothetical protein
VRSFPANGDAAKKRVSRWAPRAARALILRAEEMQAVFDYDDLGDASIGEIRILVRLSATELTTTDGWTFNPVGDDATFQFTPRLLPLREGGAQ